MPSYCIHLAIGNLYAQKNNIKDEESFNKGLIAPDFAKDKEVSHYSVKNRKSLALPQFLAKKVDLKKYLVENEIDSDFKKGEFLHLITDYIYFTQFFTSDEIERLNNDFLPTMYYSYDCIKQYVEDKYNVRYPGDLQTVLQAIEDKRKLLGFDKGVEKENILPIDKLDRFIHFCADLDLKECYDSIMYSTNCLLEDVEFK